MPFTILRDDITHVRADALVNAANEQLRQGGGVCGAIFEAAGARRLQKACDKIGHCDTGSAVATKAYRLHAKYVIHTVGPIWRGGSHGERALLASCYRSALELADDLGCRSIAFPLISAGIYGYPKREALEVARGEIRAFLRDHEMDVMLVLFDASTVELASDLRLRVQHFIDDVYVGAHAHYSARQSWEMDQLYKSADYEASSLVLEDEDVFTEGAALENLAHGSAFADDTAVSEPAPSAPAPSAPAPSVVLGETPPPPPPPPPSYSMPSHAPITGTLPRTSASKPSVKLPGGLRNMLAHLDEGFSGTLLELIDARGLKDSEVYKRANISRQHFSKIRSNPRYKPTKTTVLALAVALELSIEETSLLLERAGFTLSHADCRDVIVEFFIREHHYDVFDINEALFAYDQPLLG